LKWFPTLGASYLPSPPDSCCATNSSTPLSSVPESACQQSSGPNSPHGLRRSGLQRSLSMGGSKLVATQILRRGRAGQAPEEAREIDHRADIVTPGPLREFAHLQVIDHALAQGADGSGCLFGGRFSPMRRSRSR
jgi:hypothetical protein